ncbi:MAG: HTH domain-containing protein [Candidatus Aenigmatarchaeota archaeon]
MLTKSAHSMENNFRERIVELLKSKPDGLTILDIANSLEANRNTITKYIYELSGSGIITQRKIGVAKLCFLTKYVKKREK